ncbi:MAG TPA: hypothetical protein VN247_04095 [Arenimonas sp.]|nr:hypothetical protein [Arenimonas sp.]
MAHQDTLDQLKQKFASDELWYEFLAFIDSHKVRGCAQELWLQWEIYQLKCQAAKTQWQSHDSRFMGSEAVTNLALFQ